MSTEYYCNLQKYNKKGQRVALFGRVRDGAMEIFELTCSKKDSFTKKLAQQVYQEYLRDGLDKVIERDFHPELYLVKPEDDTRLKWSFLRYCSANYYHLQESWHSFRGHLAEVRHEINGRKGDQRLLILKTLVK